MKDKDYNSDKQKAKKANPIAVNYSKKPIISIDLFIDLICRYHTLN